jgi:DNA-binding beta-propeller fold protein YncE
MQNMISLRVVMMGLGLGVLSVGAYAQTLLVANQDDSTVSFVDVKTGTQVGVLREETPGVHAHEAAVSLDGKTAYLPIYGSAGVGRPGIDGHEMLVVDVASRKIVGHVDFGHGVRPHLPIMDPVSGMLYVSTELDKAITVIDPKTLKIVGKIPTGAEQSHMFILSHDGKRAYTSNVGPGSVSVLDVPGRKTLTVIPVSGNVQRISISNDDTMVFTSDETKPQLAVIDTATNKVKTWVPLPGKGFGAASTKDGRWLLVAIPSTNQVAVVDLKTLKVARTIDVQATPQEILVRPDGKMAYVSCDKSGKVAVIDVAQWNVAKYIAVGNKDDGLAWAK